MKLNLKHLELETNQFPLLTQWIVVVRSYYANVYNPFTKKKQPVYDGKEIVLGKYLKENDNTIHLLTMNNKKIRLTKKSCDFRINLKRKPSLNQLNMIRVHLEYVLNEEKIVKLYL